MNEAEKKSKPRRSVGSQVASGLTMGLVAVLLIVGGNFIRSWMAPRPSAFPMPLSRESALQIDILEPDLIVLNGKVKSEKSALPAIKRAMRPGRGVLYYRAMDGSKYVDAPKIQEELESHPDLTQQSYVPNFPDPRLEK